MKRLLWLPLLVLTTVTLVPAADNPRAEKEVLAALQVWKQGAMKKDRALLEKIYHSDLTYGHSGGLIQTKEQSIDQIVTESMIYQEVNFSDTKVNVNGDTAFVSGELDLHEKMGDKVNVVHLVLLTAWMKGPDGWQMIARQATRPNPPAQR